VIRACTARAPEITRTAAASPATISIVFVPCCPATKVKQALTPFSSIPIPTRALSQERCMTGCTRSRLAKSFDGYVSPAKTERGRLSLCTALIRQPLSICISTFTPFYLSQWFLSLVKKHRAAGSTQPKTIQPASSPPPRQHILVNRVCSSSTQPLSRVPSHDSCAWTLFG
jgi:hypothetical protein